MFSSNRDSSVEEGQQQRTHAQIAMRDRRIQQLQAERRPSQMMARFRSQFGVPGHGGGGNVNINSQHYVNIPYDDVMSDFEVSRSGVRVCKQPSRFWDDELCTRSYIRNRQSHGNWNMNAVPVDDDTTMTSASESESDLISSGSSVDTDDLDFSYQEKKLENVSENEEGLDDEFFIPAKSKKIDLITEDIFSDYTDSDTEYETDESEVIPLNAPVLVVISRQ